MANTAYRKTSVSGGSSEALDSLSGAILVDGDLAFVSAVGINYVYVYDSDNAGVELVPSCIAPDILPGNGRWILQVDYASSAVTASTAELNIMDGVTNSMAEMNLIDGSVAGTAVASKVLALGASRDIDTIDVTKDGLKIGATAMTCTGAELNIMDGVTTNWSELQTVVGVTSGVQAQLNAKANIASPTFTGMVIRSFHGYSYDYNDIIVDVATVGYLGARPLYTLPTPVQGNTVFVMYDGSGSANRGIQLTGGVTFNGSYTVGTPDEDGGYKWIFILATSTTNWLVLINSGWVFSA